MTEAEDITAADVLLTAAMGAEEVVQTAQVDDTGAAEVAVAETLVEFVDVDQPYQPPYWEDDEGWPEAEVVDEPETEDVDDFDDMEEVADEDVVMD